MPPPELSRYNRGVNAAAIQPIRNLALLLGLAIVALSSGCGPPAERQIRDAVVEGNGAKVRALLRKQPELANSRDSIGWSPLHWAARSGQPARAKLLIASGASVSVQDKKAGTPLHMAVYSGHRDVAETLITARADVNAVISESGRTPLDMAAYFGNTDMAALLLAHGAKVNVRNASGATPLHTAVLGGSAAVVRLLVKHNAGLELKDTKPGMTPLHWAVGQGRADIAELLLAAGADPNATDSNGYTPLHVAATEGRAEAAELLLRRGAAVNARTSGQVQTPAGIYPARTTPRGAALIAGKQAVAGLLARHGGK